MRFIGRLKTLYKDYSSRKYILQAECDSDVTEAFEALKDISLLDFKIEKHKEKRSLDANAYYWVLITAIAKAKRLKNSEVHNLMLRDYGVPEMTDGRIWYAVLPESDEIDEKVLCSEHNHYRPTSELKVGADGNVWRTYIVMKGSSRYDTAEMARLIDGTIQEARQLDIEVLPPDEIERMKKEWRSRNE